MFQKGANLAAMLAVSRYNDPVKVYRVWCGLVWCGVV